MNRPDDIPEDVWEVSLLAFHNAAHECEPEDDPAVARIARAILAERERCELLLNERDKFIVSIGQWEAFVASLAPSVPSAGGSD